MSDKSVDNYTSMSDKLILKKLGNFVQYHRIQQKKTQQTLAEAAGISRSTLSLLERGEIVTLATFVQVLRVLDQLAVLEAFTINPIISPLQLAKIEQKKRQRVRTQQPNSTNPTADW